MPKNTKFGSSNVLTTENKHLSNYSTANRKTVKLHQFNRVDICNNAVV